MSTGMLDLRVARSSTVVRSDPTLLGRMLRNLVENALRYTPAGQVSIERHETEGCLRIEVHDTGVGIPPEHLDRIWQEFHQAGNPERDRNLGLGLDLAIVQRLSKLLQHLVHVHSPPWTTLGVQHHFSLQRGRAEIRSRPGHPGGWEWPVRGAD